MLILMIISTYKIVRNQRKSSTFLTYSIKLFSTFGLLLNTIIIIPFFNIIIATLYCKSDSQITINLDCYSGIYFVHLVIGIFTAIFLIFFFLLFTLLYIDLNPSSTIPFAAPQSKTNIIRLVLKFFLPLYTTVDYGGNLTKEFISVLTIFYAFLLIQRYRTTPCYNMSIYRFMLITEMTLFWISVCAVIHAFLDFDGVDNIGLFYLIIGIPFLSLAFMMLIGHRSWNSMKTLLKNFRKDTDAEMYIIILIALIENRDQPYEKIKLEGLLRYHMRYCAKPETCYCT